MAERRIVCGGRYLVPREFGCGTAWCAPKGEQRPTAFDPTNAPRSPEQKKISNGRDDEAISAMVQHVLQHIEQLHTKQMMQMMASEIAQSIQQKTGLGHGLNPSGGAMANMQQAIQTMLEGQGPAPAPGQQQ